jgi:hypothetical protein
MQTTDPLRTPTFTDFANPTYFYQTGSCPAGSTSPGCPVVNPAFSWNHGGDQPEVDTTWLGYVGPTLRHLGETGAIWTDHTDIRPTILSILGLRSDYVQDGPPEAQIIRHRSLPWGLRRHVRSYENLVAAYKQLDAAVGQFGRDSEIVSTTAAESSSPGDAVYRGFNQQLATCQAARDALAGTINTLINNAAFDGREIQPFAAAALASGPIR